MKKALITGITGQDGSFLDEFLLEKGYEVHGITRRSSLANTSRIDHLIKAGSIHLYDGDLSDSTSIIKIIESTLGTGIKLFLLTFLTTFKVPT